MINKTDEEICENCGRTKLEHNPIAYYDNGGYLGKCKKFEEKSKEMGEK